MNTIYTFNLGHSWKRLSKMLKGRGGGRYWKTAVQMRKGSKGLGEDFFLKISAIMVRSINCNTHFMMIPSFQKKMAHNLVIFYR